MMPRDLTFLFPQASILLLAIPIFLILFFYSEKRRQKLLDKFASNTILSQIAIVRKPYRSIAKMLFFLLFWLFACLALMNPVGNEHFKSESGKAFSQDIVFLLDSSISMSVNDTPTKISRFDYAKEIADLIIKRLKGNDMMLITFTTGASLVVPQTHDSSFLRIRLKDLEMNENGNAPGTDYNLVFQELKKIIYFDPKTTPQTVVLFSDGGDTSLEGLTQSQRSHQVAKILEEISSKNFPNLRIYAIGMGSQMGGSIPGVNVISKLERPLLEAISNSTGGTYYSANEFNAEVLAANIAGEIEKQRLNLTDSKLLSTRVYDTYFQIPLIIALSFLLLYMLFPTVKRSLLGILAFAFCQGAYCSEDFIARQLFEAGEYGEAASKYQNMLLSMPEAYHPLIYYNLGTIFLAEKNPALAIDFLEIVPWAKDISSNIKRRAFVNLAVAYNLMQEETADPTAKLFYLKKALQALNQADKLDCEKEHCLPSSDFYAIKNSLSLQIQNLSNLIDIDAIALLWDEKDFKNGTFPEKLLSRKFIPFSDDKSLEESTYLFYEGMPKESLESDINRLYAFNGNPDLIYFLQKKLSLIEPSLQSSDENLLQSIHAEKRGEQTTSEYYFLKAYSDFRKEQLSKIRHSAKKALMSLIEDAKTVVKQDLLFLSNPSEMAKQTTASANVLEASSQLPKQIYQWQILRFKEGICQCKPWNEIFPLLRSGNEFWKKQADKDLSFLKISSQKNAIVDWQKALALIEQIPEGPEERSKDASEALNELQKMQLLDKEPSKPQKMPQGGKFW